MTRAPDYAARAAELLQPFSREAVDRILARDVLRAIVARMGAAMNLAAIPSPSQNGFYIGPLFIHAYGLAYVLAVSAAILIAAGAGPSEGGDPDLVYEVAMWGFPAGPDRRADLLPDHHAQPDPAALVGPVRDLEGRAGDLGRDRRRASPAGCGCSIAACPRADIRRFMDAAAPGLLVAQAIGRVGNYFNQELFGGPTSLPWALKIDPAHRPPGYAQYATFQPTFLYEIIWNLSLAAFLVWLGHHRKIRPPGLLALYVAGYSAFRIFEETLRIDYSNYILGMRLNFWIASLLCLAGLVWFVVIQRGSDVEERPVAPPRPSVPAKAKPVARKPPAGGVRSRASRRR